MRRFAELLRFRLVLGDHQVLRLGQERPRDVRVVAAEVVLVLLPDLAVLVEERLAVGGSGEDRGGIAVARGERDRFPFWGRETVGGGEGISEGTAWLAAPEEGILVPSTG